MLYLFEPRNQVYSKGCDFLSFAKSVYKNIGKIISSIFR